MITPTNPLPSTPARLDEQNETRRVDRPSESRPVEKAVAEVPAGPQSEATAIEQAKTALAETGTIELDDRTIEFDYDDEINRVIVRVRSADDGEVIRQIPPESFVAFTAKFREMLGVMFDEQF